MSISAVIPQMPGALLTSVSLRSLNFSFRQFCTAVLLRQCYLEILVERQGGGSGVAHSKCSFHRWAFAAVHLRITTTTTTTVVVVVVEDLRIKYRDIDMLRYAVNIAIFHLLSQQCFCPKL